MVTARNPYCIEPLHAMIADQDILKRVVKRMPHVKLPGDIRRRDNHAVRRLRRIRLCMKELFLLPKRIPFFLERLRVIDLWDVRFDVLLAPSHCISS